MAEAEDLARRRLRLIKRRRRKRREAAMTLVEHLGELRRRIVISTIAFAVISIVAFVFFSPILDFLLRPLCALPKQMLPHGCTLNFFGVTEPFLVRLKVSAMVGFVGSSPIWLYQMWAFIAPGMTDKERRYAIPFVVTSISLFLVGAAFSYLTLPFGLRFLIGVGGPNLEPLLRADSYLNFVGLMVMVFGVTFELPLLLFFLGLAEIITVEQLRHHRRTAIVGIFLLAAVVTPSQDPYTMTLMAVPLWALYELTILLLKVILRRRVA